MIPIRDTTPSKTVPVMNYSIITLNVLIFIFQLFQGDDVAKFDFYYGLVPIRYFTLEGLSYFSFGHQVFSFFSYMFLHGGFLHLLGNMWFLYIFGDNVEDHLGPYRYLIFYLLCGIASGMLQMAISYRSNLPIIGASGAIAGVMGAYLILYPTAKVLTLVPIFIFPFFFELPAYFFLGFWFLMQFFNAAMTPAFASGVAWWAHVGGFVFGVAALKFSGRVPDTGLTRITRKVSERKGTHRLQIIHPAGPADDPNLYGTIRVSLHEAERGARKIVNIPWGFHKQLYSVVVPPDTREGTILRLQGIGKRTGDGGRGDVMLTVEIGAA